MQLQKRDIASWIIVSSVIALLILAYLLVAIPRNEQQNLQEIPLTETSNTGVTDKDGNSGSESPEQLPSDESSDENDSSDTGPDENGQQDEDGTGEDQDDDSGTGDDDQQGEDDNGDEQNDDDNQQDEDDADEEQDDEDENSRCPPMKFGLYMDKHNDNANDNANEVRYDCNGKAVGNPFINGEKQKMT